MDASEKLLINQSPFVGNWNFISWVKPKEEWTICPSERGASMCVYGLLLS